MPRWNNVNDRSRMHRYDFDLCGIIATGKIFNFVGMLSLISPHFSTRAYLWTILSFVSWRSWRTAFLPRATNDNIVHKYARVLKWGDIKDNIPTNLKISPVAMIPQKFKAYRCILDLSLTLFNRGKRFASANENTNKKSIPETMVQLGQVLKWIIYHMAIHRANGTPFNFTKLDVKDGFWRMAVADGDAWNLCYVLP